MTECYGLNAYWSGLQGPYQVTFVPSVLVSNLFLNMGMYIFNIWKMLDVTLSRAGILLSGVNLQ